MVSTFSKTFELKPTKTGNYVIPALQVEVDGQILMSQPLKLTVTPSECAATRSNQFWFGSRVYEAFIGQNQFLYR